MNTNQIICLIGANIVLAYGLIGGTIFIDDHHKNRIVSNRFAYSMMVIEYFFAIFGFLLLIYLGFGG
jgi:uncharacterized membrane protein